MVSFESANALAAAINVAIFATVTILFIFSRFSFGYSVGFYLYRSRAPIENEAVVTCPAASPNSA